MCVAAPSKKMSSKRDTRKGFGGMTVCRGAARLACGYMGDDSDFRVEYAKTGRAICRGCKKPIAEASLKLCMWLLCTDGDMYRSQYWFHPVCFWQVRDAAKVHDVRDFEGFAKLQVDDQAWLRAALSAERAEYGPPPPETADWPEHFLEEAREREAKKPTAKVPAKAKVDGKPAAGKTVKPAVAARPSRRYPAKAATKPAPKTTKAARK